jgi:GNAT superfamily N-acetyltransferase
MVVMIDPMAALKSLEEELGHGIALIECELNPSIDLILDFPAGEQSICYANIEQGAVRSIAVLLPIEPIEGVPCFGIAFAVSEAYQRQGLAVGIVEVVIAELRHGLSRNGIVEFYIEAIVAAQNVGAQNVGAQKVVRRQLATEFDEVFDEAVDKTEGAHSHRYRRLVSCA